MGTSSIKRRLDKLEKACRKAENNTYFLTDIEDGTAQVIRVGENPGVVFEGNTEKAEQFANGLDGLVVAFIDHEEG